MKRAKFLIISLISIILVNVLFLSILIFYYDIIIIPNSFFKEITKEYYFWYMNRPFVNNEIMIMGISAILEMTFLLGLLIELLYMLSNNKYINIILKKNVVISILTGFIIYFISFLFIKYKVEHYRLFMTLIPIEILSIILLSLILIFRKRTSKIV